MSRRRSAGPWPSSWPWPPVRPWPGLRPRRPTRSARRPAIVWSTPPPAPRPPRSRCRAAVAGPCSRGRRPLPARAIERAAGPVATGEGDGPGQAPQSHTATGARTRSPKSAWSRHPRSRAGAAGLRGHRILGYPLPVLRLLVHDVAAHRPVWSSGGRRRRTQVALIVPRPVAGERVSGSPAGPRRSRPRSSPRPRAAGLVRRTPGTETRSW